MTVVRATVPFVVPAITYFSPAFTPVALPMFAGDAHAAVGEGVNLQSRYAKSPASRRVVSLFQGLPVSLKFMTVWSNGRRERFETLYERSVPASASMFVEW